MEDYLEKFEKLDQKIQQETENKFFLLGFQIFGERDDETLTELRQFLRIKRIKLYTRLAHLMEEDSISKTLYVDVQEYAMLQHNLVEDDQGFDKYIGTNIRIKISEYMRRYQLDRLEAEEKQEEDD